MAKAKQLSKRQLAVIEDLFNGELDELSVLGKYKVSRKLYNKWLANEAFVEQLDQRIAGAYRQSALLIARYAPLAAAKLVQLTESESQETARKTCLDIISMHSSSGSLASTPAVLVDNPASATPNPLDLSPETASRLLAALAEEHDE